MEILDSVDTLDYAGLYFLADDLFPMTYDATVVPKSDNEDYCSSEQSERDTEQILADIRALVDLYLTSSTTRPREGTDNS